MWKDFFYFSKGQQIGIIVFIILILLFVFIYTLLPQFSTNDPTVDPVIIRETKNFAKEVAKLDSISLAEEKAKLAERKNKELEFKRREEARAKQQKQSSQLFAFNPNTADSLELIRLGIRPHTTSNILKYREHGGKFEKADDLQKIYGLSEQQYKRLKPYISIPSEEKEKRVQKKEAETKAEPISIELNSADTTELMRISGVGSASANAIIGFRRKTGGFYSTDQLIEIKSIRPEHLERIKPFVHVNSTLIRKININKASVEYLKQHPYINFYQAKAIVEYRKAKGKIKNIEELKKLPDFSPTDWERLQYYFSFD